jgi:hypothetical protein
MFLATFFLLISFAKTIQVLPRFLFRGEAVLLSECLNCENLVICGPKR